MKKTIYFLIAIVTIVACKNSNDSSNTNISTHQNDDSIVSINNDTVPNVVKDTLTLISQKNNIDTLYSAVNQHEIQFLDKYQLQSPIEFFENFKLASPDVNLLYSTSSTTLTQSVYNNSIAVGVYIADVLYSISIKDKDKIIDYYSILMKLSNNTGYNGAFTLNKLNQITNSSNIDSIKGLTLSSINTHFSKLGTQQLPFVMYGTWLESNYLLTKSLLVPENQTDIMYKKIADQKFFIQNFTVYLKEILLDANDYNMNLNIQNIISELQLIDKKLGSIYSITADFNITADELKSLSETFSEIRNNFNQTVDTKIQMQMTKTLN